eukprot:Em0002g1662a
MDKTDRAAYKVLREHFASLCDSGFDPSNAASELFAMKIINAALRDVTIRDVSKNEKRNRLVDGVMRCGRPGTFQTFLQILYRDDSYLAEQIRDAYQKATGTTVPLEDGAPSVPISTPSNTITTPPSKPPVVNPPPSSTLTATHTQMSVGTMVTSQTNNGCQSTTVDTNTMVSSDGGSTKMSAYKMMTSPHGIALIISNIEFARECDLPYRAGADVDETSLLELFSPEYLNYKVVLLKNLTGDQIDLALRLVSGHEGQTYTALLGPDMEALKALSDVGNRISANHDSFVCCLLSHGTEGVVNGTDGKEFDLKNIYNYLGPCKHLSGKPKMAFIQACQGENIAEHDVTQPPSVEDDGGHSGLTTRASDFLLSYAAFYGQTSFRWMNGKGSWYISALCRIFKENHKTMDTVSMITDVHNKVCNEKYWEGKEHCLQCPRLEHTLRYKVQLAVKNGWGSW